MARQKFIFDPNNEDHTNAQALFNEAKGAMPFAQVQEIWTSGGSYPLPADWGGQPVKSAMDMNDYGPLRKVVRAWIGSGGNSELFEWYNADRGTEGTDFRAALRHLIEQAFPKVERQSPKRRAKQKGRRKTSPATKPETQAAVKILSERDTVEESIGTAYETGEISSSEYADLMEQLQTLCVNANAILARNNPRRNRGGLLAVPDSISKTSRRSAEGIYVYPRRKSFPIGDLYHARLALIYVMSPTNRSSRRKVIKAVKSNYPQYNWNAWWRERTGQNMPK